MAISIPQRTERARAASGRTLLVIVCAGAFVVLTAVFTLSRSSLFALRHVVVAPRDGHLSAVEIASLAALPAGTNVVWLDTAAVARRLEADPWIASATVTRSLPWTVRISVEQRTPVAVIVGGKRGTLVAGDGTHLGTVVDDRGMPTIQLPPAAPATIGMPSEGGAVRAIAGMSPRIRHRVLEIDVAVGGTLTLRLRDGSTVDLGPAVDLSEKVRVLRRLLAWEQTSGTALPRISLLAPTAPAAVPAP